MRAASEIVKQILVSEKGTRLSGQENKYLFLVDRRATKPEIRRAVEELFQVHVVSVNTMNRPGKKKRQRTWMFGRTAETKRAVVTLRKGESIPLQ